VDFISNSVALSSTVHKMLVIIKLWNLAKGGSATASTATLYISAGVHSAGSIVNHLNNDF
jgi:hypothetical protein